MSDYTFSPRYQIADGLTFADKPAIALLIGTKVLYLSPSDARNAADLLDDAADRAEVKL